MRNVAPLRAGVWSRPYAFDVGASRYVVRFSALREDFEKDRRASTYRSTALPIPRVIEIGEALGGHFAITEHAPGVPIDTLDGDAMARALPSLFAALDAARAIDLSAAAGYGGWDAAGRGRHATWPEALCDIADERRTVRSGARWRERLAASPTGTAPFDEAFVRMRALLEHCPGARHLVHSDLLYYNVLVDSDRVTALLDWGSSIYGDFLYDLAWLSFWWPWYRAWSRIDIVSEAARHYESIGLTVPRFAERLRCYELHIGLDGMSFQAARDEWDDLAWTARRALDLARRTPL